MSKTNRKFTDKELAALRSNPYTYRVTSSQIQFTAEVKEEFWQRYQQGDSCNQVVQDLGYDPDVLGKTRIYGIMKHIRDQVNSPEGIHTGYRRYHRNLEEAAKEGLPPDKAIARMQNEIIYLRQELEFKKLIIKSDNNSGQRQ